MQEEIWKDVPGYEGNYQASDLGRVRSLDKKVRNINGYFIRNGQLLKPGIAKIGYEIVVLSINGKKKSFLVHQLVAMAFLNHKPNGYNGLIVDHIDNNKLNNNVNNLQLVTVRHNVSKDRNRKSLIGSDLSKTGNRWFSRIKINGKLIHLGSFISEEEANKCYLEAVNSIENGEEIKHKKRIQASKYKGVQWNKQTKRWISNIYVNGKSRRIGSFKCELAASTAYQNELIKLNK
jgi:hypothetical protein